MVRVAAIAAALFAGQALACGYCVEDKIAAVYDHALISQALAQRHQVAFFHIDGTLPQGAAGKRSLEAMAQSAAGVDKGSARVSIETFTLAVAFDPARTGMGALQNSLDRKFAAKKLSLLPLRVMDKPAELKAVKR